MNRIDRARIGVRGEVLATFWPRGCTWANTHHGTLFLRKWRGPRRRSWSIDRRARLTSQEIDAIASGTIRAHRLRQKIQTWSGPERHRPMFDFLIGRARG